MATFREAQAVLATPERLTDELGRPILFPLSNVCADCGEPYDQPALIRRCAERHYV